MQQPWNPWRELADRPEVKLTWIERGRRGCIDFATRTITLRRSMGFEERRCVIAHELVHDERGDVPRWMKPREEAAVRRESARRLITLAELERALRWAEYIEDAAEELRVDVSTLQARLATLTDEEREFLDHQLEHRQH
ncbi:hypothetical protein [Nocardioides sp. SYSU DS0663]|uniref:hypothetical protein n=1 Tax=Nocardioides sp. SYSU DS0663 TaxID=3416445 RepID=UPI003F4BDE70